MYSTNALQPRKEPQTAQDDSQIVLTLPMLSDAVLCDLGANYAYAVHVSAWNACIHCTNFHLLHLFGRVRNIRLHTSVCRAMTIGSTSDRGGVPLPDGYTTLN